MRRLAFVTLAATTVLGRWRDELDVQHVVLFPIRKGGAAAPR